MITVFLSGKENDATERSETDTAFHNSHDKQINVTDAGGRDINHRARLSC